MGSRSPGTSTLPPPPGERPLRASHGGPERLPTPKRPLVRDLVELAQIAAEPDRPLTVTQDPYRDSAEVVRYLGMMGRAITLSDGFESPAELQRPLFKLIDYHQKLVDAGERGRGMSTYH